MQEITLLPLGPVEVAPSGAAPPAEAPAPLTPAVRPFDSLLAALHSLVDWLKAHLWPTTPPPVAPPAEPPAPPAPPVAQPPAPKPLPKPQPKPAPKPPGGSGPLLKLGAQGASVRTLQERLRHLGFDPGPLDGDFGPKTKAAVKAFQKHYGLEVDGVVGPNTWSWLGVKVKDPDDIPGGDGSALRNVTPAQLAHLGATNKAKFFATLKPAALAAEKKYGVPWQVTLAQVALESGWAKHAIGGYNVFGIKGTGPAGSVTVSTKEYVNGRYITINARFAKYHDFHEAIEYHGKVFHNGYYNKAVANFKKYHDPERFARDIHGIYATSPVYANSLINIMRLYDLS